MSADYPVAEEHFVPRSFMFNSNNPVAVIIHKTGGDATPAAVYNTFLNSGNPGKSSHFAIGTDGSIWQFVPLALGAGANGITDNTTEAFWYPYMQQYGNLNTCTISIEHCDPSPNNDTSLTAAQKQASFALVAHLCQKYNIAADHIKPHRSIVSTGCPGTYPMQELQDFIAQGGSSMQVPQGWTLSPDGKTLIATNGHKVEQGFCQHILNDPNWDPSDMPLSEEFHADPLEYSNLSLGSGQKLCCTKTVLEWTPARGVFVAFPGQEVYALLQQLAKAQQSAGVTLNPDVIAQLLAASTALAAVTAAVSKAQSELPK